MTVILMIALKFHSWHFKSSSRVSACQTKENAYLEENDVLMLFHLDPVLKSVRICLLKERGKSVKRRTYCAVE